MAELGRPDGPVAVATLANSEVLGCRAVHSLTGLGDILAAAASSGAGGPMLPGSGGQLAGALGAAVALFDEHPSMPRAPPRQPMMAGSPGAAVAGGSLLGLSAAVGTPVSGPLAQLPPAFAGAVTGLEALSLKGSNGIAASEALRPLPQLYGGSTAAAVSGGGFGIEDDGWGAMPSPLPSATQPLAAGPRNGPLNSMLLPLAQQLQAAQLQQQLKGPGAIVGQGGLPQVSAGLAPVAPRAPRARRHSMYVASGQDAHAIRRGSLGNYDAAALLQQQQAMAAAAALAGGGAGVGPFAPVAPLGSGRAVPAVGGMGGGFPLGSTGMAPPGTTGGLAAAAGLAGPLGPASLGGVSTAGLAGAPLPISTAAPAALASAQWGGAPFAPSAPRAASAVGSRRHSWCPTTLYGALQAGDRLAFRGLQQQLMAPPGDALAALQDVVAAFAPGSVGLLPGGPDSPRGAAAAAAAFAQQQQALAAAAAGLPPFGTGPTGPSPLHAAPLGDADLLRAYQQHLAATAATDGTAAGTPPDVLKAALAAAAAVGGPLGGFGPDTAGSLEGLLMDPGLLAAAAAAAMGAAGGGGDAAAAAALFDALRGRLGISGGPAAPAAAVPVGRGKPGVAAAQGARPGAVAAASSATAAPAAAPASSPPAVVPLPVPEPLSRVCSDAKWDLRRSASDPQDSAASVDAVAAWLESRRGLVEEREREARRARRAAARAASDGAAGTVAGADGADAGGPSGFDYALPDAGDDTWGGGAATVAQRAAAAPGSGAISSEPSNKLFVGNIGWWVTEEDLQRWFGSFGTITSVKIMYNSRKMHKPKEKWRSREYGFVDYASPSEAARAIVWMDGAEVPELMKDGAGIIVQYAKPAGPGE